MSITVYRGPDAWNGVEWAVNIACVLGTCLKRGEPIHVVQEVTLEDIWNERRLRARFKAFSSGLRVTGRSILLPPANAAAASAGATWKFEGAGHHSNVGNKTARGPVIVHVKMSPKSDVCEVCPLPIMPEDAYDLHVHVDAGLHAAYYGQRVRLGQLTGIAALDGCVVDIAPFADRDELRHTTLVPGAGLPIPKSRQRGNVLVFSRLRLPSIPERVLERHEPLLRSLFSSLEALA